MSIRNTKTGSWICSSKRKKRTTKPQEREIKAVIFDLGNVLLDFDHRIAAERIAKFSSRNAEEIYGLFFDSELTGLFEEGKISPLQFFVRVKKILKLKIDFAAFLPIWNEIFFLSERNQAVYDLACRLKGRYALALLSNINSLHWEYLRKTFGVFDVFERFFLSYALGLRKPDQDIYLEVLRILGALPHQVFYVDDRKELVEASRAQGIRGFVFTGPPQLKKDLASCGININ
jgi:putative hydrolase of the HAD superfamily